MEKQGDTENDDTFVLSSPMQWKAFSHPTRRAILTQLNVAGAQTNEELASALGMASGKLYFHTKRLLDAALIEPAGTRQKGPITEKLYKAKVARFVVPPPQKGGTTPPLADVVAAGLALYEATWERTSGLPGALELGFHMVLPQSPERRRDFARRLRSLFDDFREGSGGMDGMPLAVIVLIHDVAVPRQAEEGKR